MNQSHLATALFAVVSVSSVGVAQEIESRAIGYSYGGRRELRAPTAALLPSQHRAASPVSYAYPARGHASSQQVALNDYNVTRYVPRDSYPVSWVSPHAVSHGVAYRRPPVASTSCTSHNRVNGAFRPVNSVGVGGTNVPRTSYATAPASSPYYVGAGILGQPKLYHEGQPIRNVLRYVFP